MPTTEACVSTPRTCSQAANSHLFQDAERAGHPGVLHGWLCGIPRFLPGWARRPPERGGEGRRTMHCWRVTHVLRMLWGHRNGHDSLRGPFNWTLFFFFFLSFFLLVKRGEGREKERERETSTSERYCYQLPLAHPQLGTWPTTQASTLIWN